MKRNRQCEVAVALLLAFVLFACGASQRQKTIRITYASAIVADDQLVTFTRTHGKALYDEAKAAGKTKTEADVAVNAFLAKAEHAHLTAGAVVQMAAAAMTLDDDRSFAALLKVAAMLRDELKELGVTP